MERKTQTISSLPQKSQRYSGEALNNPLYIECLEIRRKFLETNLHEVDHWTWRLINDFIMVVRMGWVIKFQIDKVKEATIKYGSESSFWTELNHTKSLRKQQTLRLSNVVLVGQEMLKKGGLTQKIRSELSRFRRLAIDLRKKLLKSPLTEKQMLILWKMERICGIYYSDLSREENSEI